MLQKIQRLCNEDFLLEPPRTFNFIAFLCHLPPFWVIDERWNDIELSKIKDEGGSRRVQVRR